MGDERRTHSRIQTSVSADVTIGDQTISAHAQNLSIGGVGLNLRHPLQAAMVVSLSLFLVEDGVEDATTEPLQVQATVVWVESTANNGWEAGLRFSAIDTPQSERLKEFLARLQ